jgi:hypothetical protein
MTKTKMVLCCAFTASTEKRAQTYFAQAMVIPYLKDNMFAGRANAQQLADKIVARLTT